MNSTLNSTLCVDSLLHFIFIFNFSVYHWTCWFFFNFVTFRKGSIRNGGQSWKIPVWCFTYAIFLPVRKKIVQKWNRPKIKSCCMLSKFLVALKLFRNAKISLFLRSKWQIGYKKSFLNTNLFLIKPFLIAKCDCIS